jgi:predicted nucleic acid-binding protein
LKLVDSSVWVEFLRKKGDPVIKQAVGQLIESDLAAYTCPTWFELLSGARQEEEADLKKALEFSCHVLFEQDDWLQAASLERQLRAKGLTIPRNDLFVAVVGIRAGLPVACRDAHFDAMHRAFGKRLMVEQF